MDPIDPPLRRVFEPRQRRAGLSFRRRRDRVFFVACVLSFVSGMAALGAALFLFKNQPAPMPSFTGHRPPKPRAAAPAESAGTTIVTLSTGTETTDEAVAPAEEPAPKPEKAAKPAPPLAAPLDFFARPRTPRPEADTTSEIVAERDTTGRLPVLEIRYKLNEGRWARASFNTTQDLAGARRLSLEFRGKGASNAVEIGLVDADGTVAAAVWAKSSAAPQWTPVSRSVGDLAVSGGDGKMDWKRVRSLYVRVAKTRTGEGGAGTLRVRALKIS